jgi:DNA invertase Pin-like site-specific DNA recombinase
MPKAKKAAVYCRVSTVHQVDKDSLPMQRNDMINYAKYVLNIEDYKVFEDAGYSGKNTDRPAFQDMMTRIHQGEFSHILVWKIDRISRNLLDFATMYEECKKLGVTFVSKNEQFDTSTAMGEAMLKIILVFAELERNMTSERVSATMTARAANSQWNGGRVPFSILHRYNAINYRDESKKSFRPKEESEWILVPNHHVPLITKEQADRCQYWLEKNNRKAAGTHVQKKNVHIFAGLIHCGQCGEIMFATLGRMLAQGYQPSIYICGSKRRNKNCTNKYTYDKEVGTFIFQYISNMIHLRKVFTPTMRTNTIQRILSTNLEGMRLSSPTVLSQLRHTLIEGIVGTTEYTQAKERQDDSSRHRVKEKNTLNAEINKRIRALKRLEELYLFSDSPLPKKEYLNRQTTLKMELDGFQKKLSDLQHDSIFTATLSDEQFIHQATSAVFQAAMQEGNIDIEQLTQTLGKPMLKDFINRVVTNIISKDGHVMEITFANGLTHQFDYT